MNSNEKNNKTTSLIKDFKPNLQQEGTVMNFLYILQNNPNYLCTLSCEAAVFDTVLSLLKAINNLAESLDTHTCNVKLNFNKNILNEKFDSISFTLLLLSKTTLTIADDEHESFSTNVVFVNLTYDDNGLSFFINTDKLKTLTQFIELYENGVFKSPS